MAREKNNDPLKELADNKSKRVFETKASSNGLLARCFRTILKDLNIRSNKLNELITLYLKVNFKNSNRVEANNSRGSINKNLSKDEMTFSTFITGLRILGVYKIELNFKLHRINGKVTNHPVHSVLFTDEALAYYKEEYNKTHGIQNADKDYSERLKSQYDTKLNISDDGEIIGKIRIKGDDKK